MLVHFWSAQKEEAAENKQYFDVYEKMLNGKGDYLQKFFAKKEINDLEMCELLENQARSANQSYMVNSDDATSVANEKIEAAKTYER